MSDAQIFIWIVGQIIVATIIYSGIRADIRGMYRDQNLHVSQ